ncbi:MAG: hypothetical protein Q9203_007706, partial [Teloschistes exilis]
ARHIGPSNLISLLDLSVDMIAQEPEVRPTIDEVINRIAILGRDHSCGVCQPESPSPTESGFQLRSSPLVGFPSPILSSIPPPKDLNRPLTPDYPSVSS